MAENKDSNSSGCLGFIILVVIIAVVFGGCSACHHSNNSNSESKTHLTSKQKKAKAKKKAKKLKAEKANLTHLKEALSNLPDKTENVITSAQLTDNNSVIAISLDDSALDGSDAQVRKNAKEAWNIGNGLSVKYGPYPDGTIEYKSPIVYIYDDAGNELGRTSALGDFKWKG